MVFFLNIQVTIINTYNSCEKIQECILENFCTTKKSLGKTEGPLMSGWQILKLNQITLKHNKIHPSTPNIKGYRMISLINLGKIFAQQI